MSVRSSAPASAWGRNSAVSGESRRPDGRAEHTESLHGTVSEILFTSENDAYTVLRLTDGNRTVTAVGRMASVVPGERLTLTGRWNEHPRFGRQFTVLQYESHAPASIEGIERYLSSGLVAGIGSGLAQRIVSAFGEKTLEVLDETPGRLKEVEGIGRKRVEALTAAWREQREIRKVMVFLQSHGAGTALAARIYKRYGNHAMSVVQDNPYLLAVEIAGVGFKTADAIARSLGIGPDSPSRAEAGLMHVLNECASEGHLYCPRLELIQRAQKLLEIEREIIALALERLSETGQVVSETGGDQAVYLPAFHRAECGIARMVFKLWAMPRTFRSIDDERAVEWVQARMEITLAEKQAEAIRTALTGKITVITGGPGTGKTTILRSLVSVLRRAGAGVLLAAPTGRAAKRLSEASGQEARTIHRLLEYSPREHTFQRNDEHPLACDWLILDEASMIDAVLMYHLLKAIPPGSSLVLVGDKDQLPSVGAGRVLADVISSGLVPVVELKEIFRQAEASEIVVNAHRINVGVMPQSSREGDFYLIRREDPEAVAKLIVRLCSKQIPARFGLNPVEDIQVLSPMHRGTAGVENLNALLQSVLNQAGDEISYGAERYRVGDKMMQTRNNYDKDVFNGDIGRVISVDRERRSLTVRFDTAAVTYEASELDQITLAYAVSVHKSQGCEFPAVVLPVLTGHYMLLQRNLLYTAVTRGKRLVVLIGTRKALAMALRNTRTRERYSGLAARLSSSATP